MGKLPMKAKLKIVVAAQLLFFMFFYITACYDVSSVNKASNPLYVEPTSQDFSKNPKLLERIRSGPHGYFRFINIPFSNEVCRRFSSSFKDSPFLNLHGDAHIEQYAVTDLGRGLTDFDDSSTGLGILDWMRFGVSLQLACRAHGWDNLVDVLFGEFLRGYRDALKDPIITAPEPTVAKRMRSDFKIDRQKYFMWIDSSMEPMPHGERDSLLVAIKPYVENMLAEQPNLNHHYFDVVKPGYHHMGIGSALDLKYLVRAYGKTDDPMDDVVLEFKQVRDLSGIDCINIGQKIDPFRIILGQARIAYQPFRHLGYFHFRGNIFWVHSWVDNYEEVKVGESFQSSKELAEVAYDVGVQLGKGHVKQIAAPFDLQLRRELLQILDRHEVEIKQACRELAEQTVAAWRRFCNSLDRQSTKQTVIDFPNVFISWINRRRFCYFCNQKTF